MMIRRWFAFPLMAGVLACGDGDAPRRNGDTAGGDHNTYGGGPPGGMLVVMADREPDQLNPITFNSKKEPNTPAGSESTTASGMMKLSYCAASTRYTNISTTIKI